MKKADISEAFLSVRRLGLKMERMADDEKYMRLRKMIRDLCGKLKQFEESDSIEDDLQALGTVSALGEACPEMRRTREWWDARNETAAVVVQRNWDQ